MSSIRSASHAGSWYSADPQQLDSQLSQWLSLVNDPAFPISHSKAVIAPHAGYSYSGPPAAWGYKSIDTTGIKRVFVLGPSHHLYLDNCALSACTEYDTPIGKLPLDLETIRELQQTNQFETLSLNDDEAEHSLEMHLPYIRKIFQGQDIAIVPIMVGALSTTSEAAYGALLAPYLSRDDTFTVVSTDFCHWGTRFQYTYYYPSADSPASSGSALRSSSRFSSVGAQLSPDFQIHESIRKLDGEAIDILTLPHGSSTGQAKKAHEDFAKYLKETKNTICGRHPIGVLFGALGSLEAPSGEEGVEVKWVRYEQSSACETIRDSSVSYASAWVKF